MIKTRDTSTSEISVFFQMHTNRQHPAKDKCNKIGNFLAH